MPITPVSYHRSITPATRTIVITVPKSGNGGFNCGITNNHQQPLRVLRKSEPQPSIVSGGIGGIKRVAIDSLICEQQQCSPRKRERLTHLSQEEKLNRRKLKNRVAAQTARDRKKLRTCKLEDALKRVSQQNAELAKENARLNAKLDEVIAENSRLQQQHNEIMRIHQLDADRKPTTDSTSCDASSWLNFGSAASINAPLPWDQLSQCRRQQQQLPPTRRLLILLAYLISIYKPSSTTYCKAPTNSTNLIRLKKICSTLMSNLSNRTATTTTISRDQMHTLIELWKWRRRAPNWSSDAAIQ
jgi:exonuclease VII large subunit